MNDAPAQTRPYRSTLREEQAAQTRQRILDAAAARFAQQGYAGTSLADIAERAGVSVETVKLNGPKRELLLAAFEQAFAGSEGREQIADREAGRGIIAIEDNAAFLHEVVRFIAGANERTFGLWGSLVSAAAADPIVAEELAGMLSRRRDEYRSTVAMLDARGMIESAADGSNRAELADAMSFLLSPESYQQLVHQAGWPVDRYREWLVEAVSALILAG